MASWQWGRTMVTIDGCKLLVDHGEAQGVGVTKLSEGVSVVHPSDRTGQYGRTGARLGHWRDRRHRYRWGLSLIHI